MQNDMNFGLLPSFDTAGEIFLNLVEGPVSRWKVYNDILLWEIANGKIAALDVNKYFASSISLGEAAHIHPIIMLLDTS